MPDPNPVYLPEELMRLSGVEREVRRLWRRPLNFVIVDHFKIFGDRTNTKVRDPAFAWTVSDDVMDADLDVIGIRAYVTTTGGDCSLLLKNDSEGDTLCGLTIPGGERTAWEADGIDETLNYLEWVGAPGDRVPPQMSIQTTAGGGTRGLGVYVFYGHDPRP